MPSHGLFRATFPRGGALREVQSPRSLNSNTKARHFNSAPFTANKNLVGANKKLIEFASHSPMCTPSTTGRPCPCPYPPAGSEGPIALTAPRVGQTHARSLPAGASFSTPANPVRRRPRRPMRTTWICAFYHCTHPPVYGGQLGFWRGPLVLIFLLLQTTSGF